jgi:hypothetical protein
VAARLLVGDGQAQAIAPQNHVEPGQGADMLPRMGELIGIRAAQADHDKAEVIGDMRQRGALRRQAERHGAALGEAARLGLQILVVRRWTSCSAVMTPFWRKSALGRSLFGAARRGAAQAAQWGARPGLSGVSAQAQSARRGRAADMHQRGDWR